MCRNGRYTERGIKEIDGYGSQLWCVEADYAVALGPRLKDVGMLMEPTSVWPKRGSRCAASANGLGLSRGGRW